ncbi:MAG TPA: hypothetical protein VLL73_00280, partial [Desulfurivibrionaceae bacterium]|nr:hypothetical protein [Desulfurivibrionaceae bacterium]
MPASFLRPLFALLVLFALGAVATPCCAETMPHYDLAVTIDPASHRLKATATITLPADTPRQLPLVLHAGLSPVATTPGVTLIRQENLRGAVPLEAFLLRLPKGISRVTIRYQGAIHHPLAARGKDYSRGFDETPGTIGPEGIFLSGATAWYPQLPFERCTFRLQVTMPTGWQSVSQGAMAAKAGRTVWEERTPQEEIYLLAGRFNVSQQPAGNTTAMAFLRENDPELANRYLAATGDYLAMYAKLLG